MFPSSVRDRFDGAGPLFADWIGACSNSACPRRKGFFARYVRKSRGYQVEERWFCGAECAQDFLLERISGLLSGCCSAPPEAVRVPTGTLLVKQGAIEEWQLRQTLCMKKKMRRQDG